MSDRETVVRSIVNLWTFQALLMGRLMTALRDEGAMSERAIEGMLQKLDHDCQLLEGSDDQVHATELLASVRLALARNAGGSNPRGAGD